MKRVSINEKILEKIIVHYTNYVSVIVKEISCGYLTVEDMEEVISDVFFSLWKSQIAFESMESIKPYLAQIARNKTRSKLRQLRNRVMTEEEELLDFISIEEHITEKEQVAVIKEILNDMEEPDRKILLLYYFSGFKLEEIAEMLQISLSTIKSKIYRGRKKIVEKFEKEGM